MSERQATLIVMCGLPFAGKSTLARDLAARLDGAHVEIDQINTARGVGLNGAPIAEEEWDATYAESNRMVAAHVEADRPVIDDATNFTRRLRERHRGIADSCRAVVAIVHVTISEAEARRRWRANRGSDERHDVREEDFLNVLARFEPPGDDEGVVIRVDGTQPSSISAQLIIDALRVGD